MEAGTRAYGDGAEHFRITMLDIEVTDLDIGGWVYPEHGITEKRRRFEAQIDLPDERRYSVDLLAQLLEHHSDMASKETGLSNDLFDTLLRVVGHELFSLLFVGQLHKEVTKGLEELAEQEIDLLRIKLWFSGRDKSRSEWFASLPWEYVRTPAGVDPFNTEGGFLSEHAELVLSRRVNPNVDRELGDKRGFKVLLVCPNPKRPAEGQNGDSDEYVRVDPGRVLERLEQAEDKGIIRLERLVDEAPAHPDEDSEWVTRHRLEKYMRQDPKPVLVHFVGHGRRDGGHGQLLFSKVDGSRDWVDEKDFAKIVRPNRDLKVAFLQACESAIPDLKQLPDPYLGFSGVARSLANCGVPGVVAMQYRVKAELATTFANAFYDSLLDDNSPVDVAVENGRQAIEHMDDKRDRLGFGLPVLYLSSHNGMTVADMRQRDSVDRGDTERTLCRRCNTDVSTEAAACRRCRLRFRCGRCGERYDDPIGDAICGNCEEPIIQTIWEPDDVAALEKAPPVSDVAAGGGVRSILEAGR